MLKEMPQMELNYLGPPSPEKFLLVGILDRAFHDLCPWIEKHLRISAIIWFESSETYDPSEVITFRFIVEELQLNERQVRYLMKVVKVAKAYNEGTPIPEELHHRYIHKRRVA